MNYPKNYAWKPVPKAPGTLGETLRPMLDGIGGNFDLAQGAINQIIAYLKDIDGRIPKDVSTRVYKIEKAIVVIEGDITALEASVASTDAAVAALLARDTAVVKLTGSIGASSWDLEDQAGYPNIRAVIVDPNGESCTLTLPTLGPSDKLCLTVKCLSNGGNLLIDGGAASIVSTQSFGTVYAIPFAIIAATDGITFTTYAATLIWDGTAWQIIDNAILIQ